MVDPLMSLEYFNDVLTTFLDLECVSCVAVYEGQKALGFLGVIPLKGYSNPKLYFFLLF